VRGGAREKKKKPGEAGEKGYLVASELKSFVSHETERMCLQDTTKEFLTPAVFFKKGKVTPESLLFFLSL